MVHQNSLNTGFSFQAIFYLWLGNSHLGKYPLIESDIIAFSNYLLTYM